MYNLSTSGRGGALSYLNVGHSLFCFMQRESGKRANTKLGERYASFTTVKNVGGIFSMLCDNLT